MAFLIRLAKHQGAECKHMIFQLHVLTLKTSRPLKDPVYVEWVRGSHKVVSAPSTNANECLCTLDCHLEMNATMFFKSNGEDFQPKLSKIVFKTRENASASSKLMGEISLDLAEHASTTPFHLQLPLKKCKDKNVIVDVCISAHDSDHDHVAQSQAESYHQDSTTVSEQEHSQHSHIEPSLPIEPNIALSEPTQTNPASIKVNVMPENAEVEEPRMTPAEAFLTAQVFKLRKDIKTLEERQTKLLEKEQRLCTVQEENEQLKSDLMLLKRDDPPDPEQNNNQQASDNSEAPLPAETPLVSVEDQLEDAKVLHNLLINDKQALEKQVNEYKTMIQSMLNLTREVKQHMEVKTSIAGDLQLTQLAAKYGLTGNEYLSNVERIVTACFDARTELREREAQVQRIGQQQEQVILKWKMLAGKVVRISNDGEVEEIDARLVAPTNRRLSQMNASMEAEIKDAKNAFDNSCSVLRLEIAQLKEQLLAEKAKSSYEMVTKSESYQLEQQLLEAKVKLADLIDAFNSLEQENQQIKEQISQQERLFKFNKGLKLL
uniref:C2 NT-type domain-containing protein n=1 Tax=Spongospora subterranea TaxID=70186 RepID=A0A0H5R9B0_9EUKA|eukprot:CRZ10356.1 hypothetical protein [Spongospora subterranea]